MQITMDDVIGIMIWTSVYAMVLIPILVLIVIFTPRVLIKRYWKKPHFQGWELMAFSRFPQVVGRTCMLMGLTFLKGGRKKRQMDDYLDYVPTWFRVISIVFSFFIFLSLFIVIASIIGVGIYDWVVIGTLAWEIAWVFASVALIVGVIMYSRSKHYQERYKRNNKRL